MEAVSRALFDPFFTAPLGLEELHVSGLRAQAWVQAGGNCHAHDAARRRRSDAARNNPRALREGGHRSTPCYPLHADDLPVWADVVVALIVTSRPTSVRLAGLGQSSEPFAIGDRALTRMPALRQAATLALKEAQKGVSDLDVVELDGLTLYDDAIGFEAVGVAASREGLTALAEDPRLNPSGGSAAGYCAPAMGLVRIVEATLQLQGRAGAIQLPDVRTAMAVGSSILAAQTQTAVILEVA